MAENQKKETNPVKWVDLSALVLELKKIKRLFDKGQMERVEKNFNLNVVNKDDIEPFGLDQIKEIMNLKYPDLLGHYNLYKRLPHKGGLELDVKLGEDLVNLFTRLGR